MPLNNILLFSKYPRFKEEDIILWNKRNPHFSISMDEMNKKKNSFSREQRSSFKDIIEVSVSSYFVHISYCMNLLKEQQYGYLMIFGLYYRLTVLGKWYHRDRIVCIKKKCFSNNCVYLWVYIFSSSVLVLLCIVSIPQYMLLSVSHCSRDWVVKCPVCYVII